MLTRKQQWRRFKARIRRHEPAGNTSKRTKKHVDPSCTKVDGGEDSTSTSSTCSARSSFDSLEGEGDGDDASLSLSPLPSPDVDRPHETRIKGVSFQPEVEVFLVTHHSEIDHRAKQALWWSSREAAINKRAWLNHLGQPGCGRESALQPRPHPQRHHRSSSHFLESGGITAAGRGGSGGGGGAWSAHNPSVSSGLGILGCQCRACLTEGDEHEQQPPSSPSSYYVQPPPAYRHHRPPPPLCNAAAGGGDGQGRWAVGSESKIWDRDGDDEDDDDSDLGGKGSRSFSPASAQGSSPLLQAYDAYDDEGMFPSGSYFFYD